MNADDYTRRCIPVTADTTADDVLGHLMGESNILLLFLSEIHINELKSASIGLINQSILWTDTATSCAY